uniref:TIR domain-containing protein n=1 Tax=Haemonchus contortus TaxID=6289 RepID=A0A7I5E5G6_HAECO|nr:Leucine-rich repeat domain containing protein [Haemonchus contortus]
MRLFVAAVVAVQAIIVDTRQVGSVPGCPDLDVLEAEVDTSADFLNNLLLCFCKVQDKGKVDISCLYGSSLEHLEKATEAVKKANFSTNKISFQHTEFADSGLPSFVELAPALTSLEIRECTNFEPLVVPETTFKGLETPLKNLIIDSCGLKEIPSAITDLNQLETLILSNNKIEHVHAPRLLNKKKLNYLDLSGNFITTVDAGSFEPLQKLETLVFGERNYINDSVVDAIVTLKSLKTLDLSRADGIFEPPTEIFEALPHLEGLKMSGCSISSLEPGVFATLKNLKELDLRVNLIQNVSAYAFDGLSELNRLSLAGNYIRSIEKEIWTGLNKLKEIDLGWNEIKQLSPDAFSPLADNLETLNIRHNPLKDVPPSGLKKLRSLFLSECPIENIGPELLKDYNALETLDVAKCNLTELKPETFASQKHSLKNLHLQRNLFKTIDPKIIEELEALEQLDISGNPFLCDSEISKLILAIEDRFKTAAKEGKEFLLANANDTLCDRPYTLRRQPLLDVNSTELQPYDEKLDTTTSVQTTTIAASMTTAEDTTPFTLPDLFVGTKTNDTLFKEEPRRELYELNTANDPKNAMKEQEGNKNSAVVATVIVIAIISLIAIVAVMLFMRKKRKIASAEEGRSKRKTSKLDDGMVEIELDSRGPARK